MSVVNTEIIAATTQAVTSERFSTNGTMTVMSDTMSKNYEKITLQQTRDGTTWADVKLNGVVQALSKKHNQLTISGPGLYRMVKTGTATAIGVTRWRTEAK